MQKKAETRITEILFSDEAVKGLVLIGSYAQSDVVPDAWSDLDLVVIIDDRSISRYYPGVGWAAQFGDIYAFSSSANEHFGVIRVQYADALRVDFIIIPESSLESIDRWARNPLQFEKRCLFSRSPLLDQVLQRRYPERILQKCSAEQLEQMANDFRFKAMLAVTKAARNELLAASHLALDLIRDCLVLAMMVRDQETGTDHHRDGSRGNHLIEPLDLRLKEYTVSELLNSIERSAAAFESLALQLNSSYEGRREPLLGYIAQVRKPEKGR